MSRSCVNNANHSEIHFQFWHRAYFSRLTRERRTKGNEKQAIVSTIDNNSTLDEEELQLQEEEENRDFDSAVSASEAYDLLDDAIHVLDGMIQQQQHATTTTQSSTSPPAPSKRITKTGRTSNARK